MAEPASNTRWNEFSSPDALAEALARAVANRLRSALKARGAARLAVSGGSTPKRFLAALSKEQLDWANVVVTLVDERFVPPSSERSNERLVRDRLLTNEARLARFVGLHQDAETVEAAARRAEAGIALLPGPLDMAVLGMGMDGHTASFFPDADNLCELLDPDRRERVMPVHAPSAGEPRLTLSLARIVETRRLALHIEGADKRAVLEAALAPGGDSPIAAVIAAAPAPVHIYWTP